MRIMSITPRNPGLPAEASTEEFKSRPGLARLPRALGHASAGLRAALRHEAAFRQELCVGMPAIAFALWAAPGRWQALALVGSVVLVWIVELLNSALEALADAVSLQRHPLLGRAKDLGSAAVFVSIALALLTWAVVFWPN
jgi:diacylglycerol kinase (ATP)